MKITDEKTVHAALVDFCENVLERDPSLVELSAFMSGVLAGAHLFSCGVPFDDLVEQCTSNFRYGANEEAGVPA